MMNPALESLLYGVQLSRTRKEAQQAFLRNVPAVIGARSYGVYYLEPVTHELLDFDGRGVSSDFLDDYEQVGRHHDPVFAHVAATLRPVQSRGVLSEGDWRDHPFYEHLAKWDYNHTMQAPLLVRGQLVGTLNIARSDEESPFTPGDLATLTSAGRHLSAAFERAIEHEALQRQGLLAHEALQLLRVPVVVSTIQGQLVLCNRAADSVWDEDPGLRALVESALASHRRSLQESGKRVLSTPVQLPSSETELVVRSTLISVTPPAVISFIHKSSGLLPVQLPILTAREQEVVEMVARGLTNRQIADATFITENTVKQHLKRIFAKMSVSSRAQLTAIAVRSSAAADDL